MAFNKSNRQILRIIIWRQIDDWIYQIYYIRFAVKIKDIQERSKEQLQLQLANGDRWRGSGYLFTKDNGEPMNPDSITAWLSDFSKRHNLPHINPHAFRHTVASVLIANGVDIVTTSKQLGHAKPSTTENIYAHLIEDAKTQATECIADTLLRRKKA